MSGTAPPRRKALSPRLVQEAVRRVGKRDAAWANGEPVPQGPAVMPCVCGRPRGKHSGAAFNGAGVAGPHDEADGYSRCPRYRPDVVEDLIETAFTVRSRGFAADMRDYLDLNYTPSTRTPGQWSVRVSDVGNCARAIMYRNIDALAELHPDLFGAMAAEFEPAPSDRRAARMGQLLHEDWQQAMRVLYPWRVHEVSLTVEGVPRPGRFDTYDPITRTLLSIKTAGDWKWGRVTETGLAEEWLDQDALYAVEMEREGMPVTTIEIGVVQRADGHDVIFREDMDAAMRARAERARGRLLSIQSQFDLGIEQPRERSGPSTDGICRSCFARNHCWSIPKAEKLGRSPESLVLLGLDPDAKAVEWAINEVVTARAAVGEMKKVQEEAEQKVIGLPLGVYGTGEITHGRKGGPDWKRYAQHLAAGGPVLDDEMIPRQRQAKPTARLLSAAARARIARADQNRPAPDQDAPAVDVVEVTDPPVQVAS